MVRFDQRYERFDRQHDGYDSRVRQMPMDASESDGALTLRFDLPGIHPDHIEVTVANDRLKVSAERPPEESDDIVWLRRERPAGVHHRTVSLNDRFDKDNVEASFRDGVLALTIPIREEARPRPIAISTGASDEFTVGASA